MKRSFFIIFSVVLTKYSVVQPFLHIIYFIYSPSYLPTHGKPQSVNPEDYHRVQDRHTNTRVIYRMEYRDTRRNEHNLFPDNTPPQDIRRGTDSRSFLHSRHSRAILYMYTICIKDRTAIE